MARKIPVCSHLSAAELKERYQTNTDPVESRRFHLLWLLPQDYPLTQAVRVVGLNRDYGYDLVRRYNQHGPKGLRNGRLTRANVGRKPLLTQSQQEALRQRLKTPPDDGGQWSGPKVARWIAQTAGRPRVGNQRGWDYLKRVHFSWQRPRPRHAKGNSEAQDAFKKTASTEAEVISSATGVAGGGVGI